MKKKLSKDKRDKLILVAVFTIGISASLWVLLVKPEKERLRQVETETLNLEDQINAANRLVDSRDSFERDAERLDAAIQERETGMASGDRFYWFVNLINKFRIPYNIEIPQISPETVTTVGIFPSYPYQAARFNISGTGTYYDLGKFIADFETQYPYIHIQNLEMKPSAPNSEKLSFRMDIVTLIKPNS